MNKVIIWYILCSVLILNGSNDFYTPKSDLDNLNVKKQPVSDRPNVLLVGDSISIGYTNQVVELLDGVANVVRPTNKPRVNCGDTNRGLKDLKKWLGKQKWDVIHFNWGLHDLCFRHPDAKTYGKRDKVNGTVSVPIEKYKLNLELLVQQLLKTDATLIWANTTFVPQGEAGRNMGDELVYNAAAKSVMDKHGIVVNDIHSLTATFDSSMFSKPGDVHFGSEGYDKIAELVALEINEAIKKMSK